MDVDTGFGIYMNGPYCVRYLAVIHADCIPSAARGVGFAYLQRLIAFKQH